MTTNTPVRDQKVGMENFLSFREHIIAREGEEKFQSVLKGTHFTSRLYSFSREEQEDIINDGYDIDGDIIEVEPSKSK